MKLQVIVVAMLLAATQAAFAASASDACANKKSSAEIKACLDRASSPASVQEKARQDKQALCEQNAKNQQLSGNDRSSYLNECMNGNEAAQAAKAAETHTPPPAKKEAPKAKAETKPAAKAAGKSCATQAKEQHLKGAERKKFMASCGK